MDCITNEPNLPELIPEQPLELAVVAINDGRGFVVEGKTPVGSLSVIHRYVITGAHCLPDLPPPHGASNPHERTYPGILSLIGEKEAVAAECLFADPVADLAVLGEPDNGEAEGYSELVDGLPAIPIGEAHEDSAARLLSLDGRWFACTVGLGGGRAIWISDAAERVRGGMSGSPIVSDAGLVVGVVCQNHGPNPYLMCDLPGWLIRVLTA